MKSAPFQLRVHVVSISISIALLFHSAAALAPALTVNSRNRTPQDSNNSSRRSFLQKSVILTAAPFTSIPFLPQPAAAETGTVTASIKVTPIAHTFISSVSNTKTPVKPIRENDATRFFTNARVVHLFYNGQDDAAIKAAKELLLLTVQRKQGAGSGVTPGTVHFLTNANANGGFGSSTGDLYSSVPGLAILDDSSSLKTALSIIPSGDVVIIAPKKSNGTIINGMLVEKSAIDNKLEAGGSKSGGVISCLINGPSDPETISVLDGGYSTSTILWYGV
mmetsp:Transcript_23637/g.35035  ORF Transcript_23637/g.35035 Transcript_23637/m.35035 type:complete len:278 (+) Transcript_23637:88-921(+)